MAINWFPGHMKKAGDEIRKKLKLVDICCEIRDARIPLSSANPHLDKIIKGKKRIIILNKKDMADPVESQKWIDKLRKNDSRALAVDSNREKPAKIIYKMAYDLLKEKMQKQEARGQINPEIRMLVCGIPNVGKSSIINAMALGRKAKVGDRPGITKTQQWIKTDSNLLLLDTPGILHQKLDEDQAYHLAFTGAIRDDVLPLQDVGFSLIKFMIKENSAALIERYKLQDISDPLEVMENIGRGAGALLPGGLVDYDRVGKLVCDDFRKMRLGRYSLEKAGD